ncbi:MAG: hypothetical protein LC627_03765, partial [Verrucomicrobiaceae bacterium]|nr:hypothetical protein [Verrucomicrobiaceae bacterium]
MKKTFVDPETGWIVTQEPLRQRWSGEEVIEETITNPETGETHHCTRLARYHKSVAKWLRDIARSKRLHEESERKRKQRLQELYPELAAGT